MHVSAHLDIDTLAHETDEEVSVLLEVTAPAQGDGARAAQAVQVVLDRSGSMGNGQLEAAKRGIEALVQRLDPQDWFGLVAFDDEVRVVVPIQPLTDKAAALAAVRRITTGGSTDLSAGLFRGLQEAARATNVAGAQVLLLSDGHANAGVVDPARLGEVARKALQDKVSTTTIGLGLGYDEVLLAALSRGGGGEHVFAETVDETTAAVLAQVDGLLAQSVQAASLRITMAPEVADVALHNDLPVSPLPDGLQLELGSLYAGEVRRLVMTFRVPALASLGAASIASLDLSWIELPALLAHTVTVPVAVNVVPGDLATGRVPDARVVSEKAYAIAQRTRREAGEALRRGDRSAASALYGTAAGTLGEVAACMPAPMAAPLMAEMADLSAEARLAETDDLQRASKRSMSAYSLRSRGKGRS